jgi:hypothetical protein
MIDTRVDHKGHVGEIVVRGVLNGDGINELKMTFMRTIFNVDRLVLKLERAAHLDPLCFRVLCSFHFMAEYFNKPMVLMGKGMDTLRRAVREREDGCPYRRAFCDNYFDSCPITGRLIEPALC